MLQRAHELPLASRKDDWRRRTRFSIYLFSAEIERTNFRTLILQ
jgi:hypothetical protein